MRWRVLDIVTAAVLGVACGLIFWMWNFVGYSAYTVFDTLTPGLGGLFVGVWLLGGTLGGLIIGKPGAAIFVETLAALVSAGLGSQWGIETLYAGLAQGIGAELIFLAVRYRKFSLPVAVSAGVGSALGTFVLELFTRANFAKSLSYNLISLGSLIVTGVVLAGLVSWILTRALARTGALDRFPVGR